ncbi:MAG: restriction endonuclease subunit S [Verrucomicrobia bacterium]|nr:restriction endonuclease subunit S [Verrucomicrobiota bacterium]
MSVNASQQVKRLADLATIERDGIAPGSIKSGTLSVGLENITGDGEFFGVGPVEAGQLASTKFSFSSKHLLYGKLRPYLRKIARPDFDGICSTDILPILPSPEIDRNFLFHYLRQDVMIARANSLTSGANLPRLSPRSLAEFPIPLLPIAEQQRIAAILDRAESLRAKRRQALAKLDSLTQSIFVDVFGDLNTNPKSWPMRDIGWAVRVEGGFAFKSEDFASVGSGIIRISNLVQGKVDLADIARMPADKIDKGGRFRVLAGDILMAMSGATTGKIGVMPSDLTEPLYQNQRVGSFRITDPTRMRREFLLALLGSRFYQKSLWQAAAGVAQPNVSSGQLESISVFFPPIELQDAFASQIKVIEQLKSRQQTSLCKLDQLFASLQHRGFEGKL